MPSFIPVKPEILQHSQIVSMISFRMSTVFISVILQDPSIRPDRVDLPRNELSARHQGILYSSFDPAAARNFHADNGHTLDLVVFDDLGELF